MSNENEVCDVLVIGAGAGGMSAAISAQLSGLRTIVIEKAPVFGGTAARSGGWVWIPLSDAARKEKIDDSLDDVLTYLRSELGSSFDPIMLKAYLKAGPDMLRLFEERTSVKFELGHRFPDYHPKKAGSKEGGRGLVPISFDGRELGGKLELLAKPMKELTLLGMAVGSGTELKHFFSARKSLGSALFVAGRLVRHLSDIVRYGRGMRLVNGNALAARLGKSLFDLGVILHLNTQTDKLLVEDGRVTGATVTSKGYTRDIVARKGVVLACGGFPHDVRRRNSLYDHAAGEEEHLSVAPIFNTGDGIRLAESVGALFSSGLSDAAAWVPVSKNIDSKGNVSLYPHFVDRGKPGVIAVSVSGIRFVNESDSYHDFIRGLHQLPEADRIVHFVCDEVAFQRWGLGLVKPWPFPQKKWIDSGYLLKADTLEGLARKAGISSVGLVETVRRFNIGAENGVDPEFGRGENAYNHFQGDPEHRPNPCLAPIAKGPFYAVRFYPGDIGTFSGVNTDERARVLDSDLVPISGLYAAGNDMLSIMGGNYPGPGITLGPAMVFGYIAAMDIALNCQN